MLSSCLRVVQVPQIRNKVLLTLALLAVYRLGFSIVLAVVNQDVLAASAQTRGSSGIEGAIALLSILSASNVGMMTVFGLGIMPYISASIVFQLLATVYPPLEALQKEGEVGRRKISEYTRYATVAVAFFQSLAWLSMLVPTSNQSAMIWPGFEGWYFRIVCAVTMTSGCALLMWISEQVDEYGIGNGVSLIILSGILARLPEVCRSAIVPSLQNGVAIGSSTGLERAVLMLALFLAVVLCVVAVTQSQRRIAIHSARHSRGQAVAANQRQFLPLKVNQSGVMPVIFASSVIVFPLILVRQLSSAFGFVPVIGALFGYVEGLLSDTNGLVYNSLFVSLIYFFTYFWSAVTFNPTEIASNLRDYGSFVPGYRPGSRTAAHLESVISRLNFLGASFLSFIAIVPVLVMNSLNIDYLTASFFGGTGLLIAVSVSIDLAQKIDSYLVASNQSPLLPSLRR